MEHLQLAYTNIVNYNYSEGASTAGSMAKNGLTYGHGKLSSAVNGSVYYLTKYTPPSVKNNFHCALAFAKEIPSKINTVCTPLFSTLLEKTNTAYTNIEKRVAPLLTRGYNSAATFIADHPHIVLGGALLIACTIIILAIRFIMTPPTNKPKNPEQLAQEKAKNTKETQEAAELKRAHAEQAQKEADAADKNLEEIDAAAKEEAEQVAKENKDAEKKAEEERRVKAAKEAENKAKLEAQQKKQENAEKAKKLDAAEKKQKAQAEVREKRKKAAKAKQESDTAQAAHNAAKKEEQAQTAQRKLDEAEIARLAEAQKDADQLRAAEEKLAAQKAKAQRKNDEAEAAQEQLQADADKATREAAQAAQIAKEKQEAQRENTPTSVPTPSAASRNLNDEFSDARDPKTDTGQNSNGSNDDAAEYHAAFIRQDTPVVSKGNGHQASPSPATKSSRNGANQGKKKQPRTLMEAVTLKQNTMRQYEQDSSPENLEAAQDAANLTNNMVNKDDHIQSPPKTSSYGMTALAQIWQRGEIAQQEKADKTNGTDGEKISYAKRLAIQRRLDAAQASVTNTGSSPQSRDKSYQDGDSMIVAGSPDDSMVVMESANNSMVVADDSIDGEETPSRESYFNAIVTRAQAMNPQRAKTIEQHARNIATPRRGPQANGDALKTPQRNGQRVDGNKPRSPFEQLTIASRDATIAAAKLLLDGVQSLPPVFPF